MSTRRALITGITGQDGSYLAEQLLGRGYEVHGIIRRSSSFNTTRIDHLYKDPHDPLRRLVLHYGDLTDGPGLRRVVDRVQPDEVYHLGAQSHVMVSFEMPEYTAQVDALGTLHLLEALRPLAGRVRLCHASSSELFGRPVERPQRESTPFHPRSPYGVAKLFAHHAVINHREAYGLFAVNAILFNHESPRRGGTFVSRKITQAAARVRRGELDTLYLGNLEAQRDWGYAPEYVDGLWRMLQQDAPSDCVFATGESHSVEELCALAFLAAGTPLSFEGHGSERLARDEAGVVRVRVDPRYVRPAEIDVLCGDASRAAAELGWRAETRFDALVRLMVEHDVVLGPAR